MKPNYLFSQWSAIFHDMAMIPLAWFSALILRFNFSPLSQDLINSNLDALLIIIPIQLLSYCLFGLYKGIWRFASLPDILRILKAVAIGITLSMLVIFVLNRGEGIPRSMPVIYSILLVMFLSGPRLLYRLIKDKDHYFTKGKKVLIIGAGKAGEMLARDILRNQNDAYQPVAFVDDNPKLSKRDIHGISIIGNTDDIPDLIDAYDIELIMLATPSAKPAQMRRLVALCEQTGVPFRAVPHLQDLIAGDVTVNQLRKISIEDLLGRDPVSLDWDTISDTLTNKTILITGAGGSIGSELCRQIALMKPKKLVIFDIGEFNLYTIEMELNKRFPELDLAYYLGDVTDKPFLDNVFKAHKPQVVFHAAAYKHVPLLEEQIRQAMRNNIIGTRNTANASNENNAEIFVLVSTDKAVNPANIMGATKRASEIFCQNLNAHSDTKFVTTRFGNVLGSAGSVIPLFQKQIEKGGPITVTDERMERYFMTIPEACQLIMQTTVLGDGGEIFVLDMGEPVKISYLAEQMIRLSGKVPDEDIMIEYVGLRPGEKLFEELFHEKENLADTQHEKVFLAQHREVDWAQLQTVINDIEVACGDMDVVKLEGLLHELVPEHG